MTIKTLAAFRAIWTRLDNIPKAPRYSCATFSIAAYGKSCQGETMQEVGRVESVYVPMEDNFTNTQCWICEHPRYWRKEKSTGLCPHCHHDLLNKVVRHKKRARIKGLESTLTIAQWTTILKSSQGHCFYCHKYFGYRFLVLEHSIPIAKGGGTTAENCVPACGYCNSDRWAKERYV